MKHTYIKLTKAWFFIATIAFAMTNTGYAMTGGGGGSGGGGSNSGGGGSNSGGASGRGFGGSDASKPSQGSSGNERGGVSSPGGSGNSRSSRNNQRSQADKQARKDEACQDYIRDNLANIKIDSARGSGEQLEPLARTCGIPKQNRAGFYSELQANYADIFNSSGNDNNAKDNVEDNAAITQKVFAVCKRFRKKAVNSTNKSANRNVDSRQKSQSNTKAEASKAQAITY